MKIVWARHFTDRHGVAFGEWSDQHAPTEVRARIERGKTIGSLVLDGFIYRWIVARPNWPKGPNVVSSGYALCVREPRGDQGLEGYNEGQLHAYQLCHDDKGGYCRVWPGDDPESTYYETIGSKKFETYFQHALTAVE